MYFVALGPPQTRAYITYIRGHICIFIQKIVTLLQFAISQSLNNMATAIDHAACRSEK